MNRDRYIRYFKRGVTAIVPMYADGLGDVTIIKFRDGREVVIENNIKTVISHFAWALLIDLSASRDHYGEILGKKKNIPLVLDEKNIFLLFKTRVPIGKNDGAHTYVNCRYIQDYKDGMLSLEGDYQVYHYNSLRTTKNFLRDLTSLGYRE